MRINFDSVSLSAGANEKTTQAKSSSNVKGSSLSVEVLSSVEDNKSYEGTKKSVSEYRNEIAATDVDTAKDYMAVMSGCMSDEDFGELIKSGEMPTNVPVKDAVTILDRIKLEVAKTGKEVKGFTDTLDKETIQEITGLSSIAEEVEHYDITLDEDICQEIAKAVDEITDVTEMTEGMKRLFVMEEKPLTIDNLYLAKHSATVDTKEQGSAYFSIETEGYLAKKGSVEDLENLEVQICRLLEETGLNTDEENVEAAKWLIDNSIEITKEKIETFEKVESVSLPLSDEKLSKVIAIAISEGKNPKQADITKEQNVYEEAVSITDRIKNIAESGFVKETRILEETRLKMTVEANLKLLQSGYKIDVTELEEYVGKLKEIENTPRMQEIKALAEVEEVIEEVKSLPVAVIAQISRTIDIETLKTVADKGNPVKVKFEEVFEKYEQVATEVRRDLGDSIKKAFRNVPDILSELGMEDTPVNERAVRILGYNSIAITKDKIEEIKEADRKLANVIEKLTPRDTLTLIRKGTSPINMSIEELNEYIESKTDSEKEEIEKYSKFLYKLERDKDITPEERADYIDVYRFLHKLEKTEGAAIGMVMNAGQELNFKNLKTAMKTVKHRGMDVTVGQVYDLLQSDYAEDQLQKEYLQFKYNEMKEALKAPEETVNELVMNNVPVTAENLEAALLLRKNRGEAFRKATDASGEKAKKVALEFADEITDEEETIDAYEQMADQCKTAVYEECMNSDSFMDVRALQLVHMQLSVAKSYATEENYEVPMEIGGQVTSVNVKLVHNSEEEPNVVILFETNDLGRISARLTKGMGEVEGYISCNLKDSVTKLRNIADKLSTKISVVWATGSDTDLALSKIPMRDNVETDTTELYSIAKQFLAAMKGNLE